MKVILLSVTIIAIMAGIVFLSLQLQDRTESSNLIAREENGQVLQAADNNGYVSTDTTVTPSASPSGSLTPTGLPLGLIRPTDTPTPTPAVTGQMTPYPTISTLPQTGIAEYLPAFVVAAGSLIFLAFLF